MNSVAEKLKFIETPFRVYLVAALLLLSGGIVAWVAPNWNILHHSLIVSAPVVFAAGFLVWCWPVLKRAWAAPEKRTVISVANLFVLVLSTILARNLVAECLSLPPQDFDLTVSFFVLLVFVPCWALVVSALVGIFAVISYIGGFLFGLFRQPFIVSMKLFAHALGAFTVSFYAASVFDFWSANNKNLYPVVKWVAWAGDFQPSAAYPGIGPNERVRLHENGVISSAVIENGEVVIYVRRFE